MTDMAWRDDQQMFAFERGIAELIDQGHMERALYLTQKAVAEHGSVALEKACDIYLGGIDISDWAEIERHLEGARRIGKVDVVRLGLKNRVLLSGAKGEPVVLLPTFHADVQNSTFGRLEAGVRVYTNPKPTPLQVIGLDALIVFQRNAYEGDYRDDAALRQWSVDKMLAGLMLVIIIVQVIEAKRAESPLLERAAMLIQSDTEPRPMEVGVEDLGPDVQRLIPVAEVNAEGRTAGEEIRDERLAHNHASHIAAIAQTIAEYREIYRILRMYPFYYRAKRNQLGEMFENQLSNRAMMKNITQGSISWRMDKRKFEALLAAIAAASVDDVDAVMGTEHVDALHDQWVAVAKAKDFKLGDKPMSLFELQLAHALKFGGPVLEMRWEEAKPYSVR